MATVARTRRRSAPRSTRRRSVLLVALLGGAACGGACGGVGTAAAPGLVCAEPRVDFGERWQGAVLAHDFRLDAPGSEPVRVEDVRADCGCTVARLELETPGRAGARRPFERGEEVPGGGRLVVGVSYDTRGKRGHAPRSVTVLTPSGALELTLDVRLDPWLVAEPERVDLPQLSRSGSAETSLRVRSADGSPFALAHTGAGVPPEVRVELVPAPEEGAAAAPGTAAEWEARVALGPDLALGLRGYPIELEATPAAGTEGPFRISPLVVVRVVGEVSLDPLTLDFGRVPPDETVARTVRLRCHDPEFTLAEPSVRVLPVRPTEDAALPEVAHVTTRRVPGENEWEIQLLLTGLDGRFEGTFLGRLVVATGHPGQPEVAAAIRGFLPTAAPH